MAKGMLRARVVITAGLFVFVAWWLVVVSRHLGDAPSVNANGDVVLDEFQRTKDILLVVLPLLTTALGYWFGSEGKDKAEESAKQAEKTAKDEQAKVQALLQVTPEEQVTAAKKQNWEAFGLTQDQAEAL
jgi:hypothetical protein